MTRDNDSSGNTINPDKSPIFIIGGGRSGTTLMRNMLNAHPNIYLLEEANFYTVTGINPKTSIKGRASRFWRYYGFSWLRIKPGDILAAMSDVSEEQYLHQLYLQTMKLKAATLNRKRFGEKNPLNTRCLDKIYSDYPDARVINVVRDPRAQAFSLTTMPFSTRSLLLINKMCQHGYKAIDKHKDKILTVKLEALATNPEPIMRNVLDFVGESWSDNVLNHEQHTIEGDGIHFPWLNEARGARKNKKPKWAERLSPSWIRIIERSQKNAMDAYQYPVAKLKKEPKIWRQYLAIAMDVPIAIAFLARCIISVYSFFTLPKDEASCAKGQELMNVSNPRAWKDHPEWDSNLPPPPKVEKPAIMYC